MKCPVCTTVNLSMSDRQGVEIDYCPQCRGVWLDRGELDKLIERSQAASAPAPQATQQAIQHRAPAPQYAPPQQRGYDDSHRYNKDYQSRKKKGFLGEFFDFD
ncbi:zf-TFIIB domain-containing protein [Herbaspirillum rhizosphaerae]|uniref:TFIIB-type zinc ribbon-containing protein n=1 Tax=Herbaspirillum rhizosphaerae TaxID=346179 RepID=UPI00067DD785|nr:zf-TFIIB domain-containing protein [Herbaspirillum rhizosphaerae]